MNNDVKEFINNFDIVDNALQMRFLQRWNGRDLREKENLSEHTHLVTACAIKLYDEFIKINPQIKEQTNFEDIMRLSMLHDSLELLRGDILSITKDKIPGLRNEVDNEENDFLSELLKNRDISVTSTYIVKLADLMACYKFIEHEIRFPSNNFSLQVYKDAKSKYDEIYKEFCINNSIPLEESKIPEAVFMKGYENDAGVDILLKEDVIFMPMSSTSISLGVNITPKEGSMGLLCSRTSAANKGLIVAMCPIDPNYTGEVIAIVHNVSNNIITYKKGEAFCQVIIVPFDEQIPNVTIRKNGKRTDGKLGSTGG